ncbi:hypothetical protein K438DRAFT_1781899 [Mycena galopus ATCC 62051]|nr:hypothetical protein K438DRAFT_1781899 [Mycena galopus ATCC 62051]
MTTEADAEVPLVRGLARVLGLAALAVVFRDPGAVSAKPVVVSQLPPAVRALVVHVRIERAGQWHTCLEQGHAASPEGSQRLQKLAEASEYLPVQRVDGQLVWVTELNSHHLFDSEVFGSVGRMASLGAPAAVRARRHGGQYAGTPDHHLGMGQERAAEDFGPEDAVVGVAQEDAVAGRLGCVD